jgi:hypothetical protein
MGINREYKRDDDHCLTLEKTQKFVLVKKDAFRPIKILYDVTCNPVFPYPCVGFPLLTSRSVWLNSYRLLNF